MGFERPFGIASYLVAASYHTAATEPAGLSTPSHPIDPKYRRKGSKVEPLVADSAA
jgi:hypothetical protein